MPHDLPPQDIPQIRSLASLAGKAGWRMGLQHSRDQHLLIWLTRGQGRATIRARRQGVGTHNALFLPAGTLFSLDPGPQGFGTVVIFPPAADIALPATEQLLRIRDVHSQGELAALLEAMQREQALPRDFHGQAARAHATLISIWLRRAWLAAPAPADPRADARLAGAFADLVARDYRSGRPMADYAERLGVTPTHLTRCCNATAGRSAAALLTERSLHAARSLLADTDHPIRQIAGHLGFRSAAYFTRFVQHHTGKTPSALRATALARA